MNTKALRQKILDLAIHGKLVPQDPNDEPASVLLERIKAEKERLIKEGKIKRSKQSKTACDKLHYENIPNGWSWIKLGDVTEILSSKRVHKSDYVANGIPFYRTTEIKELSEGIKPTNSLYISKEQYQNIKDKFGVPQLGDILISAVGTIGITYVIEDNNPFYFKDGNLIWIKRCKAFIPTFLRLLLTYMVKDLRIISTSGSAYNALTIEKLLDLNILIPPFKEQRRIIDKIEYWFTSIERIERDKIELQTILKQAKSKILDLAIHGKLVPQDSTDEPACELLKRINPKAEITCDNPHYRNLPKGWTICSLEQVANILDNLRKPINSNERNARINNKHESELFPYYGATGQVGFIDDYLIDGSYLLLGEDGAPFLDKNATKAYSIEGKCWVNNHAHILKPLCNFNYLMYYLNQVDYKDYVNGSTRLKLTQSDMRSIKILLPPMAEQERISTKVKELFYLLDNISYFL